MVNAVRLVLVLIVAGFGLFGAPAAMAAQTGDSVDQLGIDYVVDPDGTLRVTETIVYRFGPSSGRHGILRDLVVREPAGNKDQRYDVSAITVTSQDAPAQFTDEKVTTSNGRDQTRRLKIGSPTQVVSGATATYVITYRVRGALRHFDDHTELYWNATGSQWRATLTKITVQVTAPEGVQKVQCYAGPSGSKQPCTQATVADGKAVFTQNTLPPQQGLTIVAAIKPGLVKEDTPLLEDPPTLLSRLGLSMPMLGGSVAAALAIPLLGLAYRRRFVRDERFIDLPPGVPTGASIGARVGRDHLSKEQIPVAFAPPKIAVAEGGLLFDSVTNARETAATLIDLAVRGAVRIQNDGTMQWAVLLDPAKATWPHEQVLLSKLFPWMRPGETVVLRGGKPGDNPVPAAHRAMAEQVRRQVSANNWYKRMPRSGSGRGGPGYLVALLVVALMLCVPMVFALLDSVSLPKISGSIGGWNVSVSPSGYVQVVLTLLLPTLALLFTWVGLRRVRRRGRRTALGRGLTDQMLGFRLYLATAEADQLRFEEGEDIFSRYLPWAIVFELADRWQRICAQLAAQGRIPADPGWYGGPSYYDSGFTAVWISDSMSSTVEQSGGGGSSSSGFSDSGGGGGGSSDSGGGGGGGSSW